MRRVPLFLSVALALAVLVGCAPSGPTLPPSAAVVDYQLGGAYEPAANVRIVVRDRTAAPAVGRYSICYVNAFQTQPGESADWPEEALLRRDGEPVIDPEWPDEVIVDTSSTASRSLILDVVAPWIRACAAAGYDAIEFDNLDTFTRTDGALDEADNLALARDLVAVAHESRLAAGQKNAAEVASEARRSAGFDFAVAEECAAFEECPAYSEVYGEHVIDIEYTDQLPRSFAEMCADARTPASTVLRDRQLTVPDDPEHVFETCAGERG